MESKAITSVMLILGMFMSTLIVAQKSGNCTFKSYDECTNACLPGCAMFQPQSTCAPFCKLSCSNCPGDPPAASTVIEAEGKTCLVDPKCYGQCEIACKKSPWTMGQNCDKLCNFSCAVCPTPPASN
ncbi:hypothetical protein ACFE04_006768 [Oxalis oulophora]